MQTEMAYCLIVTVDGGESSDSWHIYWENEPRENIRFKYHAHEYSSRKQNKKENKVHTWNNRETFRKDSKHIKGRRDIIMKM